MSPARPSPPYYADTLRSPSSRPPPTSIGPPKGLVPPSSTLFPVCGKKVELGGGGLFELVGADAVFVGRFVAGVEAVGQRLHERHQRCVGAREGGAVR